MGGCRLAGLGPIGMRHLQCDTELQAACLRACGKQPLEAPLLGGMAATPKTANYLEISAAFDMFVYEIEIALEGEKKEQQEKEEAMKSR